MSEPYVSPRGETMPIVPMLAAECPSVVQIWRVKAATDVLPLVPVTAAMVCGWRAKNFAAISASARRALSAPHERDASRQRRFRHLLREDRGCAGGERRRDEFQAVGFAAFDCDEDVARLDRARIRRHAAHVEIGAAGLDDGIWRQNCAKLHGGSPDTH